MNMTTQLRDLNVEEFRDLVSEVVRESIEDALEDISALASPDFVKSIAEARAQHKRGETKPLESMPGV